MPISAIDGCDESHWASVLDILKEALEGSTFNVQLVSASDESGVIQKRIIQNLYDNDMVVCDVSGKNPNVMFELGMRLAFDKPAVVIKDDITTYSFDTSPIEHLTYPRSLTYAKIQKFKSELRKRVEATYVASQSSNYTTFLKHFGKFVVAKIDSEEVSKDDFIMSKLLEIQSQIGVLRMRSERPVLTNDLFDKSDFERLFDFTRRFLADSTNITIVEEAKLDIEHHSGKSGAFRALHREYCREARMKGFEPMSREVFQQVFKASLD